MSGECKPYLMGCNEGVVCQPVVPRRLGRRRAHGLPAVGYAECAGVGHLIVSGKTGLLAEGNGSPDSLARLLALMTDDDRRRRMGAEAVAAMAHYAPNAIFNRWESLFRQLAARA